jgi:glyoxylase-like metal-dependent hydrolase (beta-lactamase superfamily II)
MVTPTRPTQAACPAESALAYLGAAGGSIIMITGDLMHHPIQCANPQWASAFDSDADLARKTRREFLARYSDRPVLVFGTHFATPTAGHIVRDADTWRFSA